MGRHPHLKQTHNPKATVLNTEELAFLSSTVTQIIVDHYVSEPDFTSLDLSPFCKLYQLEIGKDCFTFVDEVKLVGLKQLASVVIGKNSFTKKKDGWGHDPYRRFYLKECPSLKKLKMGCHSFSDYTVCEIENVDALETITMGLVKDWSWNFYSASLELKSILTHIE